MGESHWVGMETPPPPVLGKEYPIRRSALFYITVLLIFLMWAPANLSGITLSLNGVVVARDADLRARETLHVAGGRVVTGVSLGEALPLLYDLYSFELSHAEGTTRLDAAAVADALYSTILYAESGIRHLYHGGRTFSHVEGISVGGEVLAASELEAWISWEGTDLIRDEIGRFADLYDIQARVTVVPNTASRLTATERARGRQPDVVLIQSDYLPDLLDQEVLQPLAPASTGPGDPPDPASAAFASGGRLWAQSLYFDSHLVFYNPQLVRVPAAAARGDWTLEDLERAAGRVAGRVEVPLTWNAYSAYWLTPFVLGYGKDAVISEEGRVKMDDDPTRQALRRILSMMDEGSLIPMERDAMTAFFTTGRAAFILTGSYSIPSFESLGIPFAVAPYPRIAATGRPVAPFLDFKGFAVPRRTRNPVVARRLIAYLTAPSVQARIALPTRKMPADRSAWPLVVDEHPYAEALVASYEIGVPVPNHRSYTVYKSLMWRMLRFVLDGQMSIDDMLRQSDRMLAEASR